MRVEVSLKGKDLRVSVERKVVVEFNYSWVVQLFMDSIFPACMSETNPTVIRLIWNVDSIQYVAAFKRNRSLTATGTYRAVLEIPTLTCDNSPSSHPSSSCSTGGF